MPTFNNTFMFGLPSHNSGMLPAYADGSGGMEHTDTETPSSEPDIDT